jgi:aminopeptidase N
MPLKNKTIVTLLFCVACVQLNVLKAQLLQPAKQYTHGDSLRGTYGPSRDWWDVLKYDLHVSFNIAEKTISGYNNIFLKVIKKGEKIQLDLQEPMVLDSILLHSPNETTTFKIPSIDIKKDGNAYFIPSNYVSIPNTNFPTVQLQVYYHGKPTIAIRPPWDGGLIWAKDKKNNPWVSIACQGLGASVWYPCKDHQQDEPDSAEMHINIPDSLVCVGNGRLRGITQNNNGTATFDWAVTSPINNYTIIPYIGKYTHFSEVYNGEKGPLDMDYWVLTYDVEKAKKQFTDAPKMMKAFEHWFGPYPFYKDGYKLVQAPHLGMEHQSATAYGNQFKNGYLGTDLSGTGWGLKWDFIIIHESGHEWFANNITTKDIADMWVHEGFTNYSETLFTEFYYGKTAGEDYIEGLRKGIENDIPIIGSYNVNKEGSGDMYNKGANMIHTIRTIINNDSLFRNMLCKMNSDFYHQTVTTAQIEQFINNYTGLNFNPIFNQYLRTVQISQFEYSINNNKIKYRFTNCIKGFTMPIKVNVGNPSKEEQLLQVTDKWKTIKLPSWFDKKTCIVNRNYYITSKNAGL